ncbi:hypothetical protein OC845_001216 [Tilletia horrida]|nr:hypothetical protein OC845_001216 [Tilletia horrida]
MSSDRQSGSLSDGTLTPGSPPTPKETSSSGHSVYNTPGEAPAFLLDRARTSKSIPGLQPGTGESEFAPDGGKPGQQQADQDDSSDERGQGGKNDDEGQDRKKVEWDGPDDPQNPQNFSLAYKWLLTAIVSLLTLNVTFASSAPSTTTEAIAAQFGLTMVQSQLVTSVFLWGYCAGPFVWSASSEIYGRRPIFIISMGCYALFIIGQPLAKNPETLFVTRFLSGVCASAPLTNSGGLIADIHDTVGKGLAMSLFTAAVFVGPSLGPIVGSYIVSKWRWEGVFWVLLAFGGCCWLIIVLFLPETFAPVLLVKKAKRLRKENPGKNKDFYAEHERLTTENSTFSIVKRTVVTPFKILSMEVILMLITVYLSIVYAVLYALFEAYPVIFRDLRGMSLGMSSLPFLSVLVGAVFGAAANIVLNHRYRHLSHLWKGTPPPEERLYGAIIAGPLLVAGAFILGWTGYKPSISVWGPIIAGVPLGASITLVFISLQAFIIDTYGAYSASALAANTIVRSAVAGAFPLFTVQFFTGLGVNWAASIVGWVALALAPVPLIFYLYGPRIRKYGSRYAPCKDLEIRRELEEQGVLPKDSVRALGGEARTGIEEAKRQRAEERRRSQGEEAEKQA